MYWTIIKIPLMRRFLRHIYFLYLLIYCCLFVIAFPHSEPSAVTLYHDAYTVCVHALCVIS